MKNLLEAWKITEEKTVLKTPWFSIQKYSAIKPSGSKVPSFYVHNAKDSVMCVCVTKEGKVIVERQWRLPLKSISMDYPAGSVEKKDKSLAEAALRELKEETGYTSQNAKFIFSLYKDPGFSSSKIHVFLVENAVRINEVTDDRELVETVLLEPKEILDAVDSGEISCALCVATTLKVATMLNWYRS